MGKTRGLYNAEFPKGSWVRVAERAKLDRFANKWYYHHPLEKKQFEFAGTAARVAEVRYYNRATEIYELENVPGVWHEVCLVKATPPRKPRPPKKTRARVKRKRKAVTKSKKSPKRRASRRRKS